jgi:hypothetical protein
VPLVLAHIGKLSLLSAPCLLTQKSPINLYVLDGNGNAMKKR